MCVFSWYLANKEMGAPTQPNKIRMQFLNEEYQVLLIADDTGRASDLKSAFQGQNCNWQSLCAGETRDV